MAARPALRLITFLFVEDLERSHECYAGAFGLELVLDQGDCRIYRINDGAFLGACRRPALVDTGGKIVTIVTDDVEGMHERLVAAGIGVEQEPSHSEDYPITHAFYRDPDGHLIEVQRFDDPEWAG